MIDRVNVRNACSYHPSNHLSKTSVKGRHLICSQSSPNYSIENASEFSRGESLGQYALTAPTKTFRGPWVSKKPTRRPEMTGCLKPQPSGGEKSEEKNIDASTVGVVLDCDWSMARYIPGYCWQSSSHYHIIQRIPTNTNDGAGIQHHITQ